MKCVLAKAMQSLHLGQGNEITLCIAIFQDITIQLQQIKVSQYQITTQIDRIEKQFQQLQQVDMPGSIAKDPTPIDSSDG